MRKLILFFFLLFFAIPCFAEPITILGDVTGAAVSPVTSGRSIQSAQTVIGTGAISLGATTSVCKVILKPNASNTGMIYIGGSGVTSTNGLELATNSVTILDINTINGMYAISTTASQRLSVMTILK